MIKTRQSRKVRLEQLGDIFRVTIAETGEIKDFKNPMEAKILYNVYLTDDISYRREIAEQGYNPYTGEKEASAVDCKRI